MDEKETRTGTRPDETSKSADEVSKDNKDVESGEPVQLGKETPEAERRG